MNKPACVPLRAVEVKRACYLGADVSASAVQSLGIPRAMRVAARSLRWLRPRDASGSDTSLDGALGTPQLPVKEGILEEP